MSLQGKTMSTPTDAATESAPQETTKEHTTVPPDAVNEGEFLGLGYTNLGLAGAGIVTTVFIVIVLVRAVLLKPAAPSPFIQDTPPEQVETVPESSKEPSLTSRLIESLGRSRAALKGRFDELFGRSSIDDALFEELEEILLTSDVGMPTTERILSELKSTVEKGMEDPAALQVELRSTVLKMLQAVEAPLGPPPSKGPWVILVVGVNGSGKTTTIGKLAARFQRQGKKVMLAAGDTYRAAAAEQLQVWAERADVAIVRQEQGSDPGAVIYAALESALAKEMDIVIIDTAGRLQTRKPLMEQLKKINRVIAKHVPDGPHETLLVLDGTMGQNGLSQAQLFNDATPLTGAVVTKLDGTAKGGMILTLCSELNMPVKLIGIGEQMDDLRDFESQAFVDALI